MDSIKRTGKMAGIMYLVLAITGFFASYVDNQVLISGDALTSIQNLMNSEGLFRIGITDTFIMVISWVLLGLALYALFEAVDQHSALLMFSLVLVGSAVVCVNQVFKLGMVDVLKNGVGLSPLATGLLQGQFMMYMEMNEAGGFVAYIFYGLWLLPLAYLILKSEMIPKCIGYLVLLAGIGYLVDAFMFFIFPDLVLGITHYTFFGEVALLLWLSVKGVKRVEHNPL